MTEQAPVVIDDVIGTSDVSISDIPPPGTWPAEVQAVFARESFYSNFGDPTTIWPRYVQPEPDVSLMWANPWYHAFFKQVFLPDHLMIVAQHRTCNNCVLADSETYHNFFKGWSEQPWIHMRHYCSIVFLETRCRSNAQQHSHCGAKTTLYHSDNRMNILALAQLLIQQSSDMHRRELQVSCLTKSHIGSRLTLEFLDFLTNLVHTLEPDFGNSALNPGSTSTLSRPISSFLAKLVPAVRTRIQVSSASKAHLNELQLLLDKVKVPVNQMASTTIRAWYNVHWYAQQRTNFNNRRIFDVNINDFVVGSTDDNCLVFIILHGLAEHFIQQPQGQAFLPHPSLLTSIMPLIANMMQYKWACMWKTHNAQTRGSFRAWEGTDLPYLMHHCAMLQVLIKIRFTMMIALLNPDLSARHRLLMGHLRVGYAYSQGSARDFRPWIALLRDQIVVLKDLNDYVAEDLRDQIDAKDWQTYMSCEIGDFITLVEGLLPDLERFIKNEGRRRFYFSDIQSKLPELAVPKKLHIPQIADKDFASVQATYKDLNNQELWYAD